MLHLQDLQTAVNAMSMLVIGSARRAFEYERDRAKLQRALSLVTQVTTTEEEERQRRLAVAEVAGEIDDSAFSRLLTDKHNGRYRVELAETISRETGVLKSFVEQLDLLVQTWVLQIGDVHEEMGRLRLVVQEAEAIPVLLETQGQLEATTETLGISIETIKGTSETRQLVIPRYRELHEFPDRLPAFEYDG